YTCNIDNFWRKWAVWITETFKTINNLPIFHLNTSEFDDSVIYRRKTCGFYVKYDICTIIKRNILCSITNWYTIIYYVCLYTIKYFHPILLCSRIRFGKSLYTSMVCNSNRFMPPKLDFLNISLRIYNSFKLII